MTDDAHPFRTLAKEFAARQKRVGTPSFPASASAGKRGLRSLEENDDEGSALFLDAVQRIRPLPGKKDGERRGGGTNLGEALAARLETDRRPAPGSGTAVRENAGKSAKTLPPEKVSGAEPGDGPGFAEAMHELFSDAPAPEQSREEDFLFARAMKGVVPVGGRGRGVTAPAGGGKNLAVPDPARALRDVLEGRVEFALYHTNEFMEGYVTGVDPLVLARLRNGQYSPEKHLDLHGMNGRQAYDALVWFFKDAYQRGMRTVVVVTGRGRNSPDGVGVLRPLLQRWLCREPFKRVVLAFCTAKPGDGGPGAVYVLLRKYKKNRGKIIWEHTPSDDDFPDL